MRTTWLCLGTLLLGAGASPAFAQAEADWQTLPGPHPPVATTLQWKDLNTDWFRMQITPRQRSLAFKPKRVSLDKPSTVLCFTQGKTIQVQGQTYLVAYRLQQSEL